MSPSPVKAAALRLGLAVTDDIDDLVTTDAELGVVVAYGRIIKPHVLAALPMINVHFSLLPRAGAVRRQSSGRCWPATT